MNRSTATTSHDRGDARLLHHLGTLDRMLGERRPPAGARLEEELGTELARLLIVQLASPAQLAA